MKEMWKWVESKETVSSRKSRRNDFNYRGINAGISTGNNSIVICHDNIVKSLLPSLESFE